MSTIKLNGTTSGSSIIKAPDSGSTNQTFTLPASTGTLATTADVPSSITDNGDANAITIDSSENVNFAGANLTMTDGSLKSGVSGTFNIFGATGTAGSAAYCTYGFNGDDNTGMYSGTADTIKFATGGTERVRIQSGGGISFNGDTAAANALDDYEEGTWTPTIDGSSSGTITGTYTKIGNRVTIDLQAVSITVTAVNAYIRGLPFTSSEYGAFNTGHNNCLAASSGATGEISGSATTMRFITVGSVFIANYVAGSNKYMWLTATYKTS